MSDAPAGPLAGLLVVDLSRILAGPSCTMQLGDMGARVIKIEPPGGDETRRWGPPFAGGESAYFLSVNRNKESIVLDLKTEDGAAILWALLERADVLVENFRPRTLDRLGFGWEAVHARCPRVIVCSISGYGQTGPRGADPGFDLVAQGEGGIMSLTGPPDGEPTKVGTSQADLTAGLLAVQGILLALLARERTGKGQRVDVSLLDGQIALLSYHVTISALGQAPRRLGNAHPTLMPYESFRAADDWITVGVGTDAMWRAFCGVLGRADLASDTRFRTNADRVAHRDALAPILAEALAARRADEWCAALHAAGIPSGRIAAVPDALAAPQVRAREMVITLRHPTAGEISVPGIPVKLSQTPGSVRRAPPRLGEHTDRVLAELLQLSDERIAALRLSGAVC